MNLKERFMRRLEGKDVDKVPVGSTTTYGIVEMMKKCGAERPAADTDPKLMADQEVHSLVSIKVHPGNGRPGSVEGLNRLLVKRVIENGNLFIVGDDELRV